MSHYHFIDGTAYDASAFGQTDATTGEWEAKTSPSVTYGNNGFFILKDGNGITDQSSNSNNFTLGGGTLTDLKDNPDNTFATMNPLVGQTGYSFSQGNNTVTWSSNNKSSSSTLGITGGKFYWEVKYITNAGGNDVLIGVGNENINHNNYVGSDGSSWGYYGANGSKYNGSGGVAYGNTFTANDIISIALDMDNTAIYFAKNGTWQNSGDPTSGASQTGSAFTNLSGTIFPVISGYISDSLSFNFGNGYFGTTAVASAGTNASGNGIFEYDVPTGYTALSTKGLNL